MNKQEERVEERGYRYRMETLRTNASGRSKTASVQVCGSDNATGQCGEEWYVLPCDKRQEDNRVLYILPGGSAGLFEQWCHIQAVQEPNELLVPEAGMAKEVQGL